MQHRHVKHSQPNTIQVLLMRPKTQAPNVIHPIPNHTIRSRQLRSRTPHIHIRKFPNSPFRSTNHRNHTRIQMVTQNAKHHHRRIFHPMIHTTHRRVQPRRTTSKQPPFTSQSVRTYMRIPSIHSTQNIHHRLPRHSPHIKVTQISSTGQRMNISIHIRIRPTLHSRTRRQSTSNNLNSKNRTRNHPQNRQRIPLPINRPMNPSPSSTTVSSSHNNRTSSTNLHSNINRLLVRPPNLKANRTNLNQRHNQTLTNRRQGKNRYSRRHRRRSANNNTCPRNDVKYERRNKSSQFPIPSVAT